jgi:hypothetical protein
MAADDEARLKLKVDGSEAHREITAVESAFSRLAKSAGAAAQRGAAQFGKRMFNKISDPFLDELLVGPSAIFAAQGRALARSSGITDLSRPFLARASAQELTKQAFGLSAAFASDEQIKAVHAYFQQEQQLRLVGEDRVMRVTDPSAGELAAGRAGLGQAMSKDEMQDAVRMGVLQGFTDANNLQVGPRTHNVQVAPGR